MKFNMVRESSFSHVTQHTTTCAIAAAFKRWELRYLAHLKDFRKGEPESVFRQSDASDATEVIFANRLLADFFSCAAVSYIYELWAQSSTPKRDPYHHLLTRLSPYLSLREAGEPLWALKPKAGALSKRVFVVSGDAIIFEHLTSLGSHKCSSSSFSFVV